jgi:hypothetical protein
MPVSRDHDLRLVGHCGTMTHDDIRHGTLFAALNVLDGHVIGRCMQRHRHQEFIRSLNTIEAAPPAGKLIHAIADNYATHKHPKVRAGSLPTPPDLPGSLRRGQRLEKRSGMERRGLPGLLAAFDNLNWLQKLSASDCFGPAGCLLNCDDGVSKNWPAYLFSTFIDAALGSSPRRHAAIIEASYAQNCAS